MQYSTIFLSALAATAALAAPARRTTDKTIFVGLSNQAIELGSNTEFHEGGRQVKAPVGSSGPYQTVELKLGADVEKKDLRCQILDEKNKPIVITRGQNVDIAFADGDAGEWTFRDGAANVKAIICDPTFVKGEAPPADDDEEEDLSIRVTLSDGNLATQTAFEEAGLVREKKQPVGSSGPYTSVNLAIGADVKKQDLRCQIFDQNNHPITVKRGENIDTTFADGGNGPWQFLHPEEAKVKKIVCDPAFVKASA